MEVELTGAYALGLSISVILPILVGLVTTRTTSSGVKAVSLLLLAAINSFLVEWSETGDSYNIGAALVGTLVSFGVAVAMHFGLLKPTGATDAAQRSLVKGRHAA